MISGFIQISDELFLQLAKMITERYGIRMLGDKKIMFQARLQRRLRELGIDSFEEYAKLLLAENGESHEFTILADFISTNKTDFFRENEHFTFLSERVLPDLQKNSQNVSESPLKIWSAGSSSGQEAYSIAITIEEFRRINRASFDYSIFATDISYRMLKAVREAIYPMSEVDSIALDIKHRYFLKSRNMDDLKVRVVKNIREHVKMGYLNLMDDFYAFDSIFDVVFLRNTLIYFDSRTQRRVLTKVLENLNIGSYLFIGHSESLINMNLPIRSIAPSVYIKTNTIHK